MRFHPAIALAFLVSLASDPSAAGSPADSRLGLPELAPSADDIPALVELGRRLFSEPRLSADGSTSCSTCHKPMRHFSDGLPRAVGIRGQHGSRNTPSLLNVAFEHELFWDGRAKDLETQALSPLTNPAEHGLNSPEDVVRIVTSDRSYRDQIATAFGIPGQAVTASHVARSLAAFQRTLVAGNSVFDRHFFGGEAVLPESAVRGLNLFRGRAQCSSCHVLGPASALFTDHKYHASPLGLTQETTSQLPALTRKALDLAKTSKPDRIGDAVTQDPRMAALGRFMVTLNPPDIGKFKTPSLRNVAMTAPYMHDGSVETLDAAIELELYGRTDSLRRPIVLTIAERADLRAFLESLTSPEPVTRADQR